MRCYVVIESGVYNHRVAVAEDDPAALDALLVRMAASECKWVRGPDGGPDGYHSFCVYVHDTDDTDVDVEGTYVGYARIDNNGGELSDSVIFHDADGLTTRDLGPWR